MPELLEPLFDEFLKAQAVVMVVLAGIVGSGGLTVWVMFDVVQRMIEYNYWR